LVWLLVLFLRFLCLVGLGVYVCFIVMVGGIANGFSNAKLFSTMLKFC